MIGPIEIDRTLVGVTVAGQMASRYGGMTIGQWALSGFSPAAHLSSNAATARLVAGTTVANSAAVTFAYEGGNFMGSGFRVLGNRFSRHMADD